MIAAGKAMTAVMKTRAGRRTDMERGITTERMERRTGGRTGRAMTAVTIRSAGRWEDMENGITIERATRTGGEMTANAVAVAPVLIGVMPRSLSGKHS